MKKLIALFFSLAILLSLPLHTSAQEKQNTQVAYAIQAGDKVEFTLTSSKPFFVGGNRYILYIGDKEFYLNKQSSKGGRGTLTFLIPAGDFNSLDDGGSIYLTYGKIFRDGGEQERVETSKINRMCWSLGKFSKSLLTK